MNKLLSIAGECLLIAILAILSVLALVPSRIALALFTIFIFSLFFYRNTITQTGGLRRDQKSFLLMIFFLVVFWSFRVGTTVSSTSLIALSGGCLLYGMISAMEDLKAGRRWSQTRWEVFLSVIILFIASSATVIIDRGLLNHLSQMGIVPGRADFLLDIGVLATVWFGVDAALRRQSASQRENIKGRLWNQRNILLLWATAAVIWLRAL